MPHKELDMWNDPLQTVSFLMLPLPARTLGGPIYCHWVPLNCWDEEETLGSDHQMFSAVGQVVKKEQDEVRESTHLHSTSIYFCSQKKNPLYKTLYKIEKRKMNFSCPWCKLNSKQAGGWSEKTERERNKLKIKKMGERQKGRKTNK